MPYVLGVDLAPERPVSVSVAPAHGPPEVFGTGEEPIAGCVERLGDDVPIILAGQGFAAHDLVAELLARVVEWVSGWQGDAPDHLCISHPAPWGDYRRQLLRQAWWDPVTLVPRPVAAAISVGRTQGTVGVLSPDCFAVVRDGEMLACHERQGFTDLDRHSLRRLASGHQLDALIEDGDAEPAAGAVIAATRTATQTLAPPSIHHPAGAGRSGRPPRPPVTITSLTLPRRRRTLQLGRN